MPLAIRYMFGSKTMSRQRLEEQTEYSCLKYFAHEEKYFVPGGSRAEGELWLGSRWIKSWGLLLWDCCSWPGCQIFLWKYQINLLKHIKYIFVNNLFRIIKTFVGIVNCFFGIVKNFFRTVAHNSWLKYILFIFLVFFSFAIFG